MNQEHEVKNCIRLTPQNLKEILNEKEFPLLKNIKWNKEFRASCFPLLKKFLEKSGQIFDEVGPLPRQAKRTIITFLIFSN